MPEAGAEGKLFICVPEGEEELADFVSPLLRGADDAQGRGGFRVAGLDALQQHALELAAVLGAVSIDAAAAAIEGGAGLIQVRRAQLGVRSANGQTQRAQARGIVARPQADVGKDDAIAAEPAGGAKLADDCVVRILRAVQSTRKLRLNTVYGNAAAF